MKKLLPVLVLVLSAVTYTFSAKYLGNVANGKVVSGILAILLFLFGLSLGESKKSDYNAVRMIVAMVLFVISTMYFIGLIKISAVDNALSQIPGSRLFFELLLVYFGFLFR